LIVEKSAKIRRRRLAFKSGYSSDVDFNLKCRSVSSKFEGFNRCFHIRIVDHCNDQRFQRNGETMSAYSNATEKLVKVSFLLTKRDDLTHQEFLAYWTEQHIKLLSKPIEGMPKVYRYVQLRTVTQALPGFEQSTYDGVAEVWYESIDDLVKAMSSEHYRTVIAKDEENFLNRKKTVALLSHEKVILEV
jgi:uncharacterized protein (TIGR02118 family)